MVRVEFWDDPKTGRLTFKTGMLFIGMWNFADDSGIVRGDPIFLRSKIFPYKKLDLDAIVESLKELLDSKLIFMIIHNGEIYYWIRNFLKHQKIINPSKFRYILGFKDNNYSSICMNYKSAIIALNKGYSLKEKIKIKVKENNNSIVEDSLSEPQREEPKTNPIPKETELQRERKRQKPIDRELAKLLGTFIKNRQPKNKDILKQENQDYVSWAREIRLMREQDERDPELIKVVIIVCQNDNFWSKNIRSTGKLRVQFDQLTDRFAYKIDKILRKKRDELIEQEERKKRREEWDKEEKIANDPKEREIAKKAISKILKDLEKKTSVKEALKKEKENK